MVSSTHMCRAQAGAIILDEDVQLDGIRLDASASALGCCGSVGK